MKYKKNSRYQHTRTKFLLSLISGAGAGAISKTCVAPLERIKILLQVQMMTQQYHENYIGILSAFTGIARNEGILAYWKGNMANCIRIIPNCALKFTLYDNIKRYLVFTEQHNLHKMKFGDHIHLINMKILSGAVSGAISLTLTYPIELIRTRLTSSQAYNTSEAFYKGMTDCFVKTVRMEGFRSLYKGYTLSMFGIIPYLGLSFGSYDTLKSIIPTNSTTKQHSTFMTLLIGAIAGTFAQTMTFPIDTVRNRLQVDGIINCPKRYYSTIHAFRSIIQSEGWKSLFNGLTTNLIKGAPSIAIEFFAYEQLKRILFTIYDKKYTRKTL